MRFINPKTDLAFKKIFGSDASHEILIDFLDSLLYASRGIIADLEIINPWLAPKIRGVKGLSKVFRQKKIAIARNLLDVLDDATISAKTGMAAEEVASLRGNSG